MHQDERRWDNDLVGHGIADGHAMVQRVEHFLATLSSPLWIAEAPEGHLLPHLEPACAVPESSWQLVSAIPDEQAVYQITLVWSQPHGTLRRLRGDVFTLVGTVAESAKYIHQQVVSDEVVVYDVCTGMLVGDEPFHPHGHLMRLTVQRR